MDPHLLSGFGLDGWPGPRARAFHFEAPGSFGENSPHPPPKAGTHPCSAGTPRFLSRGSRRATAILYFAAKKKWSNLEVKGAGPVGGRSSTQSELPILGESDGHRDRFD